MRTFRVFFIFSVIAVLASIMLPVQAQGPKPEAKGLRPDTPQYALHGPYWVGTRETEVVVNAKRTLPATIWYPALNPKGLDEVVDYPPWPGNALRDADPDAAGGPYPLVVWSHGYGGTRFYGVHIHENLASYGFVVVAIEHLGNDATADPELLAADQGLYIIQRPLDVRAVIDLAATFNKQGALSGMIDLEHVAVSGLSTGGLTALVTGGARLNIDALRAWCKADSKAFILLGKDCQAVLSRLPDMAAMLGLKSVPEGLWPSMADPRAKAIVALVPGPAYLNEASVQTVTIPTMVLAAGNDQFVSPESNAIPFYKGIQAQKALAIFEYGTHGVSGGKLPEPVAWALPEYGFQPVWDLDRAADLTDHLVTAFLLDALKGDKEAHKALLPDAVKFTGVEYKTTLKWAWSAAGRIPALPLICVHGVTQTTRQGLVPMASSGHSASVSGSWAIAILAVVFCSGDKAVSCVEIPLRRKGTRWPTYATRSSRPKTTCV